MDGGTRVHWLLLLVIPIGLVLAPSAIWYVTPTKSVRIRVVDKTVPHPNYREHAGLFWLMNHLKIRPPGHNGEWEVARDYVGYHPTEGSECTGTENDLVADDLFQIDLLFVADTYGVYTLDIEGCFEQKAALDYSHELFGGFDEAEANLIAEFTSRGGMLIGEFNTFASPTYGAARRILEDLFGVRWTLWSGRYFQDLANEDDVPVWARRNWLKQYHEPWEFEGPGFLFTHEDERLFVLEAAQDVAPGGLLIHNVAPKDPLLSDTWDSTAFRYWFDVLEVPSDAEILAEYRMRTTPAGRKKMEAFGVPQIFPCVVRSSQAPLRLYFAGDFSDNLLVTSPFNIAGWAWARREGFLGRDVESDKAFYWRYYVPLLGNALRMAEASLGD